MRSLPSDARSRRPVAPSMNATRTAAIALACLAAVRCGSPTELGPPTAAVATRSCGPTDGPAVTIYLAERLAGAGVPPAPHVRVALWQPPARLADRTWVLTDGRDGGAWRHTSAMAFEVATRGTVTVYRVAADTTIEGAVDLTFPGGARVRQTFHAAWHPDPAGPLCG